MLRPTDMEETPWSAYIVQDAKLSKPSYVLQGILISRRSLNCSLHELGVRSFMHACLWTFFFSGDRLGRGRSGLEILERSRRGSNTSAYTGYIGPSEMVCWIQIKEDSLKVPWVLRHTCLWQGDPVNPK